MSYQNFIPEVWAEQINHDLERLHVFAADCNRQYEGSVKQKGDSVRILGVGKPTITTTTNKNITLSAAETVEDTAVTMPINHIAYFNYKVDDIDKRQAVGGIMEALAKETSEGLADVQDKFIADLAKAQEAVLYSASASPTEITTQNVLGTIDGVLEKLYENDVKPDGKITITVPPWFYTIFKQAYINLDTDNSDMLKNGKVGRYGNVLVRMSNNVAKATVSNNTVSLIQVKTDKAIAFVRPMVHTEPYRPENGFSDAVKGFVLYDGKIVRPKEMIVLNCYKG